MVLGTIYGLRRDNNCSLRQTVLYGNTQLVIATSRIMCEHADDFRDKPQSAQRHKLSSKKCVHEKHLMANLGVRKDILLSLGKAV